jgi:hypothetical protein
MLRRGCTLLPPAGTVLLTAGYGHHGQGVARVAGRLGRELKLVVLLPVGLPLQHTAQHTGGGDALYTSLSSIGWVWQHACSPNVPAQVLCHFRSHKARLVQEGQGRSWPGVGQDRLELDGRGAANRHLHGPHRPLHGPQLLLLLLLAMDPSHSCPYMSPLGSWLAAIAAAPPPLTSSLDSTATS